MTIGTQNLRDALYHLALTADQSFTNAITATFPYYDRWTVTHSAVVETPSIHAAYQHKIACDEAWLTFMRTHI